jgi:4-amino-4-deoxy-L-arabinose transferase-like glycosyltransferase
MVTSDQAHEHDVPERAETGDDPRQPDWWHRDHPTFTALTGFFTGLGFVIVVPGLFVALLHLVVGDQTAEDLFPFVLVTLAVPIGLVVAPRTRRFGTYMLIGLVTTAVVVGGVAALVLWIMISRDA